MPLRYNVSKLLEVFYSRELASHTSQSGKPEVIINCVDPGLCHSELAREAGYAVAVLKVFLARTMQQRSRTLVNAVEGGKEDLGQYLSSNRIRP